VSVQADSPAVLFVDDEAMALKYFRRAFAKDFRVLTAGSVAAAEEVLAQEGDGIGVVITDQRMPGETGVDLLRRLRRDHPAIVRMLTTAYSDLADAIEAVNRGEIFRYITKPWKLDELGVELRQAMAFHELRRERDALLAEKLSAQQRMLATFRARDLLVMAASLQTLHNAQAAVKAYLDLALPVQTPTPDESEPWALLKRETERSMALAEQMGRVALLAGEPARAADPGGWLAEACAAAAAEGMPAADLRLSDPPSELYLDARLAGALVAEGLRFVVSLGAGSGPARLDASGTQSGGLRLRFEPSQQDAATDSGPRPFSHLEPSVEAALLAVFLTSFHHGGSARIDWHGQGAALIADLPARPDATPSVTVASDWVASVLERYDIWATDDA
jgi:two-component system probable response regulator PhcQ